jgi:methylated-DNA-[protein]-cysteine S-methyltransferase
MHRNRDTATSFVCIWSTPFGPVALLWSVFDGQPKILRVLLTKPGVSAKDRVAGLFPDSTTSSCSEIDVIADDIGAFLRGEDIGFSLEMVRMDLCSGFQQDVLRAEHRIPRGAVATYQGIAQHVGSPAGARAVGNALANNPFPIIVPCHRAIRADGTLGGYQGGITMKRALLEMEGIAFDDTGCIAAKGLFY